MRVIFTKHENQNYSVVVIRSDRIKLQFRGVGKKFLVPHDLSHFIVESKLNMRLGFWGCVDNGALLPGMNIMVWLRNGLIPIKKSLSEADP